MSAAATAVTSRSWRGRVLVVLNGAGHLAGLRELVAAAAADEGLTGTAWPPDLLADGGLGLDEGADLLAGVFGSVQRFDFITGAGCLVCR